MIDNTLTIAVDLLNSGSTTDKVYTRFEENSNRSVYNGPDHNLSDKRDTLTINRTMPNKNGNFRGTGKSGIKFTKDHSVDGVDTTTAVVVPAIIECNTSFPIGMTSAERVEMRQRLIAVLDNDNLVDRVQGDLEY